MEFSVDFAEINRSTGMNVSRWAPARLAIFDSSDALPKLTVPRKISEVLSIVCISGSLTISYDHRTLTMGPRSLMSLLPGHLLEGYKLSDDFKGFIVVASPAIFQPFLPLMSRMILCSFKFQDNPIMPLSESEVAMQVLFRDLISQKIKEETTPFNTYTLNKICEGIFCETLNVYLKRLDAKMTTVCKRSEVLFYRFISCVEKYFTTERSISFYADKLCVTPKHLSAVVKEISTMTAGDWIDTFVVNEIKRLLGSTEMSIQEISCRLQFANQSFFGKYFKNHTGMSPRQYRQSLFD